MQTKFFIIIKLICFLFAFNLFAQSKEIKGLAFPERYKSSFLLSNNEPFYCDDSLEFNFKFSLSPDSDIGNIFLLNGNDNFFVLLNVMPFNNVDTIYLFFQISLDTSKIKIPIPKNQISLSVWHFIKLKLKIAENILKFSFDDLSFEKRLKLPKYLRYEIIFGIPKINSPRLGFNSAYFYLKDVSVVNSKNEINFWHLDELEGNLAYDSIGRRISRHQNCKWIKAKHLFWEKNIDLKADKNAAVAYNSKKNSVLILNQNNLIEFDTKFKGLDTIKLNGAKPITANQAVFDPISEKVYAYYYGQGEVSVFNPKNKSWSKIDITKDIKQKYYLNASFVDNFDNLYMLGGYGWYTVKNHLQKYNFTSNKWEILKTSGDALNPRNNISVTIPNQNNEIYIFGGQGNDSGKQEDGWIIFKDTFILDLNSFNFKKVGELKDERYKYISKSSNLIFNNNSLISLIIANSDSESHLIGSTIKDKELNLKLVEILMDSMTYRFLGSTVQIANKPSQSFGTTNLFRNDFTDELFLVQLRYAYTENVDSNEIFIYSISYPPLNLEEERSKQKLKISTINNHYNNISYLKYFLIIATIGISILFVTLVLKKIKTKNLNIVKNTKKIDNKDFSTQSSMKINVVKNYISLFGEFQAYDNLGNNISNLFSPKCKELFLLILFHSDSFDGSNNTGISSSKITDIIWPDYSLTNSKNIRGITIHNLRNILEKIAGIELVFENKKWFVKYNDPSIIDYVNFLNLTKFLDNSNTNFELIYKILSLVKDGGILTYESYNWLDGFKYKINELIINIFLDINNKLKSSLDSELIIQICDKILSIDNVHENAMLYKIRELKFMGEYGKIKGTFDIFCKRYSELYAEEYPKTFENILKFNNPN